MDEEMLETSLSNVEKPRDKKKISYDFDIVLQYIGQMGRYQMLVSIFLVYMIIPIGMSGMSVVFVFGIPQHRCQIPGVDGNPKYMNYSDEYLLNISTPKTAEVSSIAGCDTLYLHVAKSATLYAGIRWM